MQAYDLCVAWNWIYDADFIRLLDNSCQMRGLSLLQITPGNLPQMLNSLAQGELSCRVFFDRASDEDAQFLPLVQWMGEEAVLSINAYDRASRTWDKAVLHGLLVSQGLSVPYTIILPPYIDQTDLSEVDVFPVGGLFTLKPAHGSGGVGVITQVASWEQVLAVRKEHATDQYLLQAHVIPIDLQGRPAWFRVIYCTGMIYPCWWNPINHVYAPLSEDDKKNDNLAALNDIVVAIAEICGLDLFSTEIALTSEGSFVVVDYVNDQIDLRLQSNTAEGVPDAIVSDIAERLATRITQFD